MEEEIYLCHDRYTRLVERLASLKPCPFAGVVTADQVKIALGEVGDIWPAEIYSAVVAARLEALRARCASR